MKEKEFMKKYPKDKIEIGVYYWVDDDGEVVMDFEGMKNELDWVLKDIEEFVNKDELQQIVSEKLNDMENKDE